MRTILAHAITALFLNKVQFMHTYSGVHSLRWIWTPWTMRFAHGGWVYLSPKWIARFRNGAKEARK